MKYKVKRGINKLVNPCITLFLALFVSGVVFAGMGYNPFEAYYLILSSAFESTRALANILANSIPLILAGLAVSVAGKAGVLNLGVEGQLYTGAMIGTLCALFLPITNKIVMISIVLIMSIIGGAVWGGIVGGLKAKYGTNEVVVAIMLNYIAELFTTYLIASPLKAENTAMNQTDLIPESARFLRLVSSTQITATVFIAIIVCIFVWILFKFTTLGYKMICVGTNAAAAFANGIRCNRYIILAMCLSGAIAGLAGITEITGRYYRFTENFSNDIGFTGVAIAALAGYHPVGVVAVALLFSILNTGALRLGREMGISSNMSLVIQGIIVLFVATPYIICFIRDRKVKRGTGGVRKNAANT